MAITSINVLQRLDSLMFNSFRKSNLSRKPCDDSLRMDIFYQRAIALAETTYGVSHGETGLLLLRQAAYYRRIGRMVEASLAEKRAEQIADVYRFDQSC